ncbi:tandem-95 repeat protein [Sesbania bispinosa]|nr:tandem-95 repeat protein [Sesbania bispinosa]
MGLWFMIGNIPYLWARSLKTARERRWWYCLVGRGLHIARSGHWIENAVADEIGGALVTRWRQIALRDGTTGTTAVQKNNDLCTVVGVATATVAVRVHFRGGVPWGRNDSMFRRGWLRVLAEKRLNVYWESAVGGEGNFG